MKHFAIAGLFLAMASSGASAQVNAGEQPSNPNLPFTVTQITTLSLPWRIAFLPDGRMLITEKVGALQLVTQQGAKTPVANVPPFSGRARGECWACTCRRTTRRITIFTSPIPSPETSGSSLALARAQLVIGKDAASLEGLQVIWRDGERGKGGQFGAAVAFSPDGKYLFLTVRRPAAHDAGPGSQPAARQDPAPDARWQTGPGQSHGRQDRRGHGARH